MTMRISGIVPESIVDGPGIRFVVFAQGCLHNCPGCHNPQTHDLSGGSEISPVELVDRLSKALDDNPLIDGITLSGGEPMLQAASFIPLADYAHDRGLDVWLYTGYTAERILAECGRDELELMCKADVLVDGPFEAAQRTIEIPFVGSTNQRVIKSPRSLLDAEAV